MMMMFLILTAVVVVALTLYFKSTYSKLTKRGVLHLEPTLLVGNMGRTLSQKNHFSKDIERLYFEFPDDSPRAQDAHFVDHKSFFDGDSDSFFGRNLIAMKGQEWKDMRSTLSPAFTSSKMKLMLPFMVEVGDQMINTLKNKIQESGVGYVDIEGKDMCTRYGNDVIASCAFGLKVNSLAEENNEFYNMGKIVSTMTFMQIIKFLGFMISPKIMSLFKTSLFDNKGEQFFRDIVLNTMRDREANNIVRPDMIQLLMIEARKEWSDNDLIAQAALFFLAGFETVASAMSFALQELALHPEAQEKLVQEIKENELKNGGKIDFNAIHNMKYLDMVVSETLRLWPPNLGLDRKCIKDYNLGKPNAEAKEDYIMRSGEGLTLPTWAFHHDPKYFPNPNQFDPERFSEENRQHINMAAYMPFGIGPRSCIGSRFALYEVKVMLYQLLRDFEVTPCEKTCNPTELSAQTMVLTIKGGPWMRLRTRP